MVTHPSTNQVQCCLTSVISWELVRLYQFLEGFTKLLSGDFSSVYPGVGLIFVNEDLDIWSSYIFLTSKFEMNSSLNWSLDIFMWLQDFPLKNSIFKKIK